MNYINETIQNTANILHLCDTVSSAQHQAFIWLSCAGRRERALILGGGRRIDFFDIGLSLALEVLFALSSDYLQAV